MSQSLSLACLVVAIGLTACTHPDPESGAGGIPTTAMQRQVNVDCLDSIDPLSRPEQYLECQDRLLRDFDRQLSERLADPSVGQIGTTVWLETAGRSLNRLNLAFLAQRAVHNEPAWQAADRQFGQRLRSHRSALLRNPQLIAGIRRDVNALHSGSPSEHRRLVEQNWQQLQRSGAFLSTADADRLEALNQQLNELQRQFRDNLDRATLQHETLIMESRLLAGLSADSIDYARQDARDRGHQQGWVLTLKAHRYYPALRDLTDRRQRRALHRAHQFRAGGLRVGQAGDNPELMRRILSLRLERARLLGFEHALDFKLADSGLGSADQLFALLDTLEAAARPVADREVERLRQALYRDGIVDEPQPWDLRYYAERMNRPADGGSDGQPTVTADQALAALFDSARDLWALEFEALDHTDPGTSSIPRFTVRDPALGPLGTVMFDLAHRRGKQGGAWMSVLQHAESNNGQRRPAIVQIQSNLEPLADGRLILDENAVETLFHEFGHVLMELFSSTRHRSLAGNQLPLDAVEVPALIFERLAFEAEALNALQTGRSARVRFGRGYDLPGLQTLREIALIRIDLAWHSVTDPRGLDPDALASRVVQQLDLPNVISAIRADDGDRSVFGSDRGGQRYRGLWANALAADVARALDDHPDRPAVALRLRQELFSRGNSRDLGASVQRFLGRTSSPQALICELGLRSCTSAGGFSLDALSP